MSKEKIYPSLVRMIFVLFSIFGIGFFNVFSDVDFLSRVDFFKEHAFDIALVIYPLIAISISDVLISRFASQRPTVKAIFHKKKGGFKDVLQDESILIRSNKVSSVFCTFVLSGNKSILNQYQFRISVPKTLRIQPDETSQLKDEPSTNSITFSFDDIILEGKADDSISTAECKIFLLSNVNNLQVNLSITPEIERKKNTNRCLVSRILDFIFNRSPVELTNRLFIEA